MTALRKLFEPIRIGQMELRNRLVFAPINSQFGAEDGAVTQRLIDYHVERAKGGVGLIILDNAIIEWPRGKVGGKPLRIDNDKYIAGLNELVEEVHAWGAKIAAQINHVGRVGAWESVEGEQVVSASEVSYVARGLTPRPLTVAEIKKYVETFAQAARRSKQAGFDAVEIHAAHGYLITQFLSPYTNRRTDDYGGSLKNRMRFLLEIVQRIRQMLGADYPILCRLSGSEFVEGGLSIKDTVLIAQELEAAGVNAIDVSAGIYESCYWTFPSMAMPRGCMVHLAEAVKKAVNIAVITVGRINDPLLAKQILQEKRADLVAMGRPLLADPELPKKAAEGRLEDIRPCIACNDCIDRTRHYLLLGCAVNPELGREVRYKITPAEKAKRVLIVGGGPAGMETARVARLRGHQVLLCERNNRLGGQLLLASAPPFKKEIVGLITYFINQLERLGVEVRLRTEVTPRLIEEIKPEAVILATGAEPLRGEIFGRQRDNVITANELLAGERELGDKVIVVGGGQVGCDVAELLATQGHKVAIVEMLEDIAQDMEYSMRLFLDHRFAELGIRVLTKAKVEMISEDSVVFLDSEGKRQTLEANAVVLALGSKANNKLMQSLKGKVAELYTVGDCVAPRKIYQAIHEGARVARLL
ncbi:MAG: FAD-dependent oxidoreductase [Chloroflexi bacterium]|nr:FAD-dependent oxidoreductase [Chloroflexota bacterium]MCL5075410.1 FAD-dependent oxidoreductase [Chloroflexota bacterium]